MAEKFNPAPIDRHAADPKQAEKVDKASNISGSSKPVFPASLV